MWPCVVVCGVGFVCLCLLHGPVCCGAVPRPRGVRSLYPPTRKGRRDGEGTVWEHQASVSLLQGDNRCTCRLSSCGCWRVREATDGGGARSCCAHAGTHSESDQPSRGRNRSRHFHFRTTGPSLLHAGICLNGHEANPPGSPVDQTPGASTVAEEGPVCAALGFPVWLSCTLPVLTASGAAGALCWDKSRAAASRGVPGGRLPGTGGLPGPPALSCVGRTQIPDCRDSGLSLPAYLLPIPLPRRLPHGSPVFPAGGALWGGSGLWRDSMMGEAGVSCPVLSTPKPPFPVPVPSPVAAVAVAGICLPGPRPPAPDAPPLIVLFAVIGIPQAFF